MNTQLNLRNLDVCVPFQADKPAPQAAGAPEDLLDLGVSTSQERQALITVAMLFAHPDVRKYNERSQVTAVLGTDQTQAISFLAMWAAGARVRLSADQFRALQHEARAFISNTANDAQDRDYASYALRKAVDRAHQLNVFEQNAFWDDTDRVMVYGTAADSMDGFAAVDFTTGRGYGFMDNGLNPSFDQDSTVEERLLTYAALFAHSTVSRTNSASQAVCFLALYGLGARVNLELQTFRALERRIRKYLGRVKHGQLSKLANGSRAHYVLMFAQRRARKQGLI